MVDRIYPTKLQLDRASFSDTELPFMDLNLCTSHGTVSTKIYDERDDFDFHIVCMSMSPGVPHKGYTYINLLDSLELLRLLVTLNAVIKPLLPNFLGSAIVILNFVRRFRKFLADTMAWFKKTSVSLLQGISEPEFYGDLVYRFRKT